MGTVPTGLRMNFCFANPTLKRGANERCAYGAVGGYLLDLLGAEGVDGVYCGGAAGRQIAG
jgi:hypothetical protein